MDFIRRILQIFASAKENNPFGQLEGDDEEEVIITVHPDQERNAGIQYL